MARLVAVIDAFVSVGLAGGGGEVAATGDVEVGVEVDAFVFEPADEVEEGVGGVDVGEAVVVEIEGEGDAAVVFVGRVHSAVISVTAARAEVSSTMAFLVA